MNNSYYQHPSELGQPLLDLLNIDTSQDCITTIESCEALYGYDFCHCSIIKYLWRLGAKDPLEKECHKILDYIDRAIASDSVITESLAIARSRIIELLSTEKSKPSTVRTTEKIDPIDSVDWFLLKEIRYITSAGKRGKNRVYADRYVYSPSSPELGVIEGDGTLYRFGQEGTLLQIQEESGELDEIIEYHLIGYPFGIRVTR